MTMSIPQSSSSPHWSRLWQVPTLLAGLAVFGIGAYTLYHNYIRHAVPFETHLSDARQLLNQKDYNGAIRYINTLADHFPATDQQAQLEVLAADAYYLAAPDASNYQSAIEHYQKARQLGWPKPGMDKEQTRDR